MLDFICNCSNLRININFNKLKAMKKPKLIKADKIELKSIKQIMEEIPASTKFATKQELAKAFNQLSKEHKDFVLAYKKQFAELELTRGCNNQLQKEIRQKDKLIEEAQNQIKINNNQLREWEQTIEDMGKEINIWHNQANNLSRKKAKLENLLVEYLPNKE
jgi:gas vesicle protein